MRKFVVPEGMPRSIFENKYSRRKADGTFQNWEERVSEVVAGNFTLDPGASPDDYQRTLELAIAGVMPFSGRHLQHGDLDQKNRIGESYTNCFGGETLLATLECGSVSMALLEGKEVTVRARDGVWRKVLVRRYGSQVLNTYTFVTTSASKNPLHVRATADHRWFVRKGTTNKWHETVTTSLSVGDQLISMPAPNIEMDPEAIQHGIVFGDGSGHKRLRISDCLSAQGRQYCSIRLCGDSKSQLQYFEGFHVTYPPHAKGDPVVYIGKRNWKDLPHTTDPSYILGFIHGWWLADGEKGYHSKTGIRLHTADENAVAWLLEYASYAGYCVVGDSVHERKEGDGSYKNGSALHGISLRKQESCVFRVQKVQLGMEAEPVYCLEEPITSGFMLGNGLLTGNCATALFSFVNFWLLLKGSGVGRCYDSDLCRVNWDNIPNVRFVLNAPDIRTGEGGHPDYETWIEGVEEARHKYDSESEMVRWFTVEDSAEGWVKVIEVLETAAWQGKHKDKLYIFDFSQVRGRGVPIVGQQGRPASGPVPFIKALIQVCSIRGAGMKPWKQAMYVDHYLADCVAMGGIRRSARIAVKSWRDRDVIEFIDIKRGGWLHTANNSVGLDAEFWSKAQTPAPSHARRVFEAMCSAGYFDNTGEPGFLNLHRMTWNTQGIEQIQSENLLCDNGTRTLSLHPKTLEMMSSLLQYAKSKRFQYLCNPCGEVVLAVWGAYCVIGDVCLANAESLEEARDAARLMAPFLMRTNLMQFLYKAEVKRTNRIGVGITGIHEFAYKHFGLTFWDLIDEEKSQPFWDFIASMREAVEKSARQYAEHLGVVVPHTMLTIKPSGCRPWYALTSTTQGLLTQEELFEGHPVGEQWAPYKGEAEVLQGGESRRILRTYANGVSSLVKVRLSYGLTVESTPEHPWFVQSRHSRNGHVSVGAWVPAAQLRKGDVLQVNMQVYNKEQPHQFVCVDSLSLRMRGDAYELTQPKEMSSDIAWLIGYLWGDGAQSVSKYRLRFIDEHIVHLERARRVLMESFGLPDMKILPASEGRNASVLEVGSKLLWHWMIRNDIQKLYADRVDLIPACVRSSTREHILAFLAGLIDADGCASVCKDQKKTLVLTTADSFFADHVQQVSWAVGVGLGCSHNTLGENYQTRKSIYLLSLSGHADPKSLQVLLRESAKMRRVHMEHPLLPWACEVSSSVHVAGKVRSVELRDSAETYDIEVEGNHWYFAGAIRSHNTISKVCACTEGAHLPAYAYFVRWVQYNADAPEVLDHQQRGYPVKDISQQYPGRVVVGFPTKLPIADLMGDAVTCAGEPTPEQHYAWLRLLEKHWLGKGTHGQVSYSLKYDPEKLRYEDYMQTILKNQSTVRACSFMPQADTSAYAYVPEEVISKEVYDSMTESIRRFSTEAYDEVHLACAGGACPLEPDRLSVDSVKK